MVMYSLGYEKLLEWIWHLTICLKITRLSEWEEKKGLRNFEMVTLKPKGYVQLKILVVLTTKAKPPPPGKALIVQNRQKKITQLLSS